MTIGVPTRLISLSDLSDEQVDAWRRLAARAAEPNPFFEPEFVLPAAARSTDGRGALLVLERDGEWLACLPVRPARHPSSGRAAGVAPPLLLSRHAARGQGLRGARGSRAGRRGARAQPLSGAPADGARRTRRRRLGAGGGSWPLRAGVRPPFRALLPGARARRRDPRHGVQGPAAAPAATRGAARRRCGAGGPQRRPAGRRRVPAPRSRELEGRGRDRAGIQRGGRRLLPRDVGRLHGGRAHPPARARAGGRRRRSRCSASSPPATRCSPSRWPSTSRIARSARAWSC